MKALRIAPWILLLPAVAWADPPPPPASGPPAIPPAIIHLPKPMSRFVPGGAPVAQPSAAPVPSAPPQVPAQPVAPAAPRPVHPRRRAPAAPKPPPAPTLPSPDVRLTIDTPSLFGPWVLHVTNASSVPVRIAADARLLSLEVTPRGERAPLRCALPADMRPNDNLDRSLVLPPGRSYSEPFEPRIYCFGERASRALAPQAVMVARLGWTAGSRDGAREAVSAIDGVEPAVANLASIAAPPIALPDDVTPPLAPPDASPQADRPMLRVTGSVDVDAETSGNISITVTVHNDGSRPVRLRFRPETLGFDLTTSSGAEACAWPQLVGAPMRELFSTLPPHGSETQSVLLADYCNARTFEHPGLVLVRPQLDARHAGGDDLGIEAFTGRVYATEPTVVRLHQGTGTPRLHHPHID